MNPSKPKRPRFRLDRDSYERLCRQVLERDGWRCQNCGNSTNLQVHHVCPRSLLGDDIGENLIVLCSSCHREAHLHA